MAGSSTGTCKFLVILGSHYLAQANCWFFVSLLQQYLGDTGDGNFTHGNLPYPELASDIRERVKSKMQLYYRLPHPEMVCRLVCCGHRFN